MKHPIPATVMLVVLFVAAQLLGLGLLVGSLSTTVDEQGNIVVDYEETAIGERPETTGIGSLLFIVIGVAVGTAVILILAKYKQYLVWKVWYFLAVLFSMWISLGVLTIHWVAGILALGLTIWKVLRPNMIIHNLTEVLIYSGIAVLLVPLFDIFWASALLIAIAIYDAIAVWKSKHMISMAKFQTDSKLFAGLMLSYGGKQQKIHTAVPKAPKVHVEKKATHTRTQEVKTAILGGGDIAFPLVFSGTIMQALVQQGYTKLFSYGMTCIVVATAAISLLALFVGAKKDRFYPAMPFITAGCFLGLGIVLLLT